MRKKINFVIIMFLMIIMCLTACNQVKNENVSYPTCSENEILIYDRLDKRFIAYNIETKSNSHKQSGLNMAQYDFSPFEDVYASGDSIEHNFEILSISNDLKNVVVEYKMKNNDVLLPLASEGINRYYIHEYYDENMNLTTNKESIAIIENNKIKDIYTVDGSICTGTIYNNQIYYIVDDGRSDTYSIMKLDLREIENGAQLVMEGLTSQGLITTKDGVYYANNNYFCLLGGAKKFKYYWETYSNKDSKYVYQMYSTSAGCPVLEILDLDTMKSVFKKEEVIDFRVVDNKLSIYGNGFMESRELNFD